MPAGYSPGDPVTWGNQQLAGQLTFSCVDAGNIAGATAQAAAGVGGIALLNNDASKSLAVQLAGVRAAGTGGVAPFVAADEEGGQVQRLAAVIYPLPSAKVMGGWSDQKIEDTAYAYGQRMLALGVSMELAPIADLDVPGAYIDLLDRAFSADPNRVTTAAAAWLRGMSRAGVVPTIKHWPGHGSATDSHTNAAPVIPPLAVLETRDMVPFNAAFAAGTPVVMVGHLQSAGLTEPGLPATLSANAMRYLRAHTGPATVIMTDSLTMAGASSGLGITPEQAAVRALRAGADWALTCATDPVPTITAIRQALDSGVLPHDQALASARRIMALKLRTGLVGAGVSTGPRDLYAVQPVGTGSGAVEVHALSGASGYQAFTVHAATALAAVNPADWRFFLAPYAGSRPDLLAVHLRGTASGRVEVHVLSASSGYTAFAAHAATALTALPPAADVDFTVGGYRGDGHPDLYFIPHSGTGSGHVEVHVLAAAGRWSSFLRHAATPLSSVGMRPGQWRFLVGDSAGHGDLLGILHGAPTGSGRTEVHILSEATGYHSFSAHVATAAGPTTDSVSSWVLGDADGDGLPDVVMVLGGVTGTHTTEVHALGGRTGFHQWTMHTGTSLGLQAATTQLTFG